MDIRFGGSFGGSPLDRLNNRRAEAGFVKQCARSPSVCVLVVDSCKRILVKRTGRGSSRIAWIHRDRLETFSIDLEKDSPLLLGSYQGAFYFAAVVSDVSFDKEADQCFQSLRSSAAELPAADAASAAQAISLLFFHERHRFCGLCGSRNTPDQGGTRLRCLNNVHGEDKGVIQGAGRDKEHLDGTCTGIVFPRIDPVAIMLVIDASSARCLLGRQARFPPGMYSCLAGFMEHGECVDDAARREVLEESGVRVGSFVRFYGSQPWPQPYSLMLGMVMQAEFGAEAIMVDKNELEEARWFSREEVARMVAAQPNEDLCVEFVPPATAIAGQMLRSFAASDPITCFPPQ